MPPDVAARVDTGPAEHWDSHVWNSGWYEGRLSYLSDRWPMVVKLSDRVEVEWFKQVSPIGWSEHRGQRSWDDSCRTRHTTRWLG